MRTPEIPIIEDVTPVSYGSDGRTPQYAFSTSFPWIDVVLSGSPTPEAAYEIGRAWCRDYVDGAPWARHAVVLGVMPLAGGCYNAVVNYYHSNS